jgi:AraC-like DNA-binding protein
MQFLQQQSTPRLAPVVKTIWRIKGTRDEFMSPEPIVPDGCVEIVFNLGDRFVSAESGDLQPRVLLAGQMTRPVVALPTGEVDLMGVRFLTGRAGAAFRLPMWELQDALIDASLVVRGLDRLAGELGNMADHRRLEHLDIQLTSRLALGADRATHAVDQALALIESRRGIVPIEAVARAAGITRRHLERRFRDEVGLGAKQFARITRVHAALRMMRRQPQSSGAEIATYCGYSDQAHLIRECQSLTGRTPARLMTSERSLAGLMREAGAIRSA